ncbi:hypothetical protein [Saccharothrix sp. NRRL B-16348]|uniref:hypothetical protein n=1 Tax=Saccharothrix sp. NRRL B-16348 TaxID=1415542 RepID=UPI0006AE3788|nr:hypothetical protein [Saccharothrix sp. NRRL B-16348]
MTCRGTHGIRYSTVANPLLIAATTAGNPADADPWDEADWCQANPAVGDFLSLTALREGALEARNDPLKRTRSGSSG